eukprot:jgi/Bigna1/83271/fgenesh1_pg.105_\
MRTNLIILATTLFTSLRSPFLQHKTQQLFNTPPASLEGRIRAISKTCRNSGLASPTSITIGGRPGSARAASLSVADLERGEGERKVSQSINGVLLKRRSSSVRDLHVDTSAGGPNALGTHTVGIGVVSGVPSGSGNPTGNFSKSKWNNLKFPRPKGQFPASSKKLLINPTKGKFQGLAFLLTSNSAPKSPPRSPKEAKCKLPRSNNFTPP